MKKVIYYSAAVVLAFLGYSYLNYQVSLLLDYCYLIKKFKIKNFDFNKITFSFDLIFKNLSKIKFTILGYNFNIYLEDFFIANVRSNKRIFIDKESQFPINVEVDVSFVSLIKDKDKEKIDKTLKKLIEMIKQNKWQDIKFVFKGNVSVIIFGIKLKRLPIEFTYTIRELITSEPTNCRIEK